MPDTTVEFGGSHYGRVDIEFQTASVLHVGDGNTEWFNEDKNKKGEKADYSAGTIVTNRAGQAFIPGSQIAGVFRHFLVGEMGEDWVNRIFGKGKMHGDSDRSRIYFHDSAPFDGGKLEKRKRTKVSSKTGVADTDERALFAMLFLPSGKKSSFTLEFFADSQGELDEVFEAVKKTCKAISDGQIRFGANSTNGAGRLSIIMAKHKTIDFSQNPSEELKNYIANQPGARILDFANATFDKQLYSIALTGRFTSAFITNGEVEVAKGEEKGDVQLSLKNSAGKYLIPGSSLKGVLRHECERILNTVYATDCSNAGDGGNECKIVQDLFGYTVKNDGYGGRKGCVTCDDVIVEPVVDFRKNRTPIDRFIQGVITGMLSSYQPIAFNTEITLTVRFDEARYLGDVDFARKLLKLACEQIARNKIAIGGRTTVGNGYFKGAVVELGGDNG